MVKTLAILLTFCFGLIIQISGSGPIYDLEFAPVLFRMFIQNYNKQYSSNYEVTMRYEYFLQSLREINELNAGETSSIHDINQFADYSPEEMKYMNGFKKPDKPVLGGVKEPSKFN